MEDRSGACHYGYDLYGNRTSQTPGPSVTFNTANQMVGFTYDAAGNLMKDAAGNSYTYDAEGNVIQVTGTSVGTVKYTYDALNHRVRVDKGSTYQEYDFNTSGQRASIWNGTSNVQGQCYLGAGAGAYYTGGAIHFEHKDWLGTERIRTTYNGAVEGRFTQLAFGDGYTATGTDTDDAHYASLDYDSATQSSHAQFRELDTIHGRWFSPDPYDGSYDPSNPQSFNRYNYALNNPVAAIDPSGLECADDDDCGDDGSSEGGSGGEGGGGGGGGGDSGGGQGGSNPGSGSSGYQPTPGCDTGCVDQSGNLYGPTGSGGITDGSTMYAQVNSGDPDGISIGFIGFGPAYNGMLGGLTLIGLLPQITGLKILGRSSGKQSFHARPARLVLPVQGRVY